ncbi:cobalamin B12-binding domain-containing protein [Chloroflexota bacterium]
MERKFKVLIAKPGLDGHDVGAKIIIYGLRDIGMEVIYTGLRQTPEMIAEAALQEDVDVVGLSCLSGAHKYLFSKTVEFLKEKGLEHILLIGGGIIPPEDISFLKKHGIDEIFTPGTSVKQIADYIRSEVKNPENG